MVGNRVLIVGADAEPASIFAALRSHPAYKVHILATPREREEAHLLENILDEQGFTSRVWVLHVDATEDVFATASQIISEEQSAAILAAGVHQAALLSAAYVHGIPAMHVVAGRLRELPVLPFDYASQLSGAKLAILHAVHNKPSPLQDIIKLTHLKPNALSYHLHGGQGRPGLFTMLVLTQDEKKRLILTSKGKTLVRGLSGHAMKHS